MSNFHHTLPEATRKSNNRDRHNGALVANEMIDENTIDHQRGNGRRYSLARGLISIIDG